MADFAFGDGFDPTNLPASVKAELEALERTIHISGHRAVIVYYALLLLAGGIHRGETPALPEAQALALDSASWALRLALSESGVTVPAMRPLAPLSAP